MLSYKSISKNTRMKALRFNTKEEDLKLAKRLLKEYQAKGDKKNIEICLRNIKNFSK